MRYYVTNKCEQEVVGLQKLLKKISKTSEKDCFLNVQVPFEQFDRPRDILSDYSPFLNGNKPEWNLE